ncbi:unnamed protein product [Kuraishia capsulata CBS 1993]|uniref:Uncharacterized protein n=1 Tax=Kuraishia capsulata CBS 1993 TaxID=1382522 RepID=W6MGN9_9ASCO|nr:uncharacterized protein KUCA_T00000958001 [Kuraishia capsulata CBS 1993]CDK24991.1 unnamed protein product [Kuraishia capsulata CBS 1993]
MSASLVKTYNAAEWVLGLTSLANHGVIASLSDGSLRLYASDPTRSSLDISRVKAHTEKVSGIRLVDGENLIVSSGSDTVKVWDLRSWNQGPAIAYKNDRDVEFLSVGAGHGKIAAGTELQRPDAELYLWDLRSTVPLRKFVDSHQDDITEVRFHPTNPEVLLSGSTDGYVNIYDLTIPEEDDALHQVINFASIHSANFLSNNRIYTLSHMETFAIHELNDKSDDNKEPKPVEYGDIRETWGCEYVVDLYPGFVACGSSSKSELKLYKFDATKEKVRRKHPVFLPGAHGDEVVRSVHATDGLVFTGGEDSKLKVWKTEPAFTTSESFFSSDEGMEVDREISPKESAKSQKHDSDTKKKHKKHKKHKHSGERFKPY